MFNLKKITLFSGQNKNITNSCSSFNKQKYSFKNKNEKFIPPERASLFKRQPIYNGKSFIHSGSISCPTELGVEQFFR